MMHRRSLVVGIAGILAMAQAGCAAFDEKLAAIWADPMATWNPPELVRSSRRENPAHPGGIGAAGDQSSLIRTLELPSPSSVMGALEAAIEAAVSAGWAKSPEGDWLRRELRGFQGLLIVNQSPSDATNLVLSIHAS